VPQNILYAVMDCLSQPAMTIVDAPVLRKTLGRRGYGAWMLVNSIHRPCEETRTHTLWLLPAIRIKG
jgi:hypothetical protein